MKPTPLVVLAAVLAAVAVFLIFWPTDPDSTGRAGTGNHIRHESTKDDQPAPHQATPSTANGDLRDRATPRGFVELRFKDEQGTAIGPVQIWSQPPRLRTVPVADITRIAVSDTSGHVRLSPLDPDTLQRQSVIAGAHGFVAVNISEKVKEIGTHDVTLRHGERLAVRCVDTADNPVHNARVAVSRETLLSTVESMTDPMFVNSWPGSDPRTAIYFATSDEGGFATFNQLTPGQYAIHGTVEGLHVVSSSGSVIVPDDGKGVITFGILYTSILRIEGDSIIGGSAHYRDTSGRPLALGHGLGAVAKEKVRKDLVARIPADWWVVLNPKTPVKPAVKYKLLLENAGFQEFVDEASPLVEPPIVTTIDASTFERKALPSAEVVVRMVDEDGKPFKTTAPWMCNFHPTGHADRKSADDVTVTLKFGTKQRLPAGVYSVDSFSSIVSTRLRSRTFRVLPGEPDTTEPQKIDLVIDGSWVPCVLRVLLEGDEPVPSISITLTMQSGGKELLSILNGEREVSLPVGSGSISLMGSQSYLAGEMLFEVKPKTSESSQEIVYRVHRAGP